MHRKTKTQEGKKNETEKYLALFTEGPDVERKPIIFPNPENCLSGCIFIWGANTTPQPLSPNTLLLLLYY